jgi:hypothetical protein
VSEQDTLNSGHWIYQEILRHSLTILAQMSDVPAIPSNRFNKRITIPAGDRQIMIRGKRRGDTEVLIESDSGTWVTVFVNTVGAHAVVRADDAQRVVLPALRRATVLDALSDV